MVLFMQQPVQYIPHPGKVRDKDKIWALGQTGEIFVDYSSYLQRRDFYLQKKFTCEITGVSGLTFFDAIDSELEGNRSIKGNFPDALREPVLRKVQFSTLPRIDDLVNLVFDEFLHDFFPGETVVVSLGPGETAEGIIREKATIRERKGPDGIVLSEATSHYFVRISARPGHLRETFLDSQQLSRDRRLFTKSILRSFLKNSLIREPWPGAPWNIVKEVAREYHIDTEFPLHLRRGQPLVRKPVGHRSIDLAYGRTGYPSAFLPYRGRAENGTHPDSSDISFIDQPSNHRSSNHPLVEVPPPPPPIKYPIEDLNIPGNGSQRPKLKFVSPLAEAGGGDESGKSSLSPDSVGPLLEVWNMLNIYKDVFVIDSFTFDDMLDAFRIFSDSASCELLVEVHCAILSQLVNPQGDLLVDLPEDDSEDEQSDDEDDETEGGEEDPEADAPTQTPRSGKARNGRTMSSIDQSPENSDAMTEPSVDTEVHRATELIAEYNWVDMLKARDFHSGGWEVILAGILCQLSLDEHFKPRCDLVLAHLVPIETKPTHHSVRNRYRDLDINLRISALEMICMLAVQTRAIREHMDLCNERMTEYRKEKIDHQRKRKNLLEELRELDEQRKTSKLEILAITEANPPPPTDLISLTKPEEDSKDEDEEVPTRLSRWANDRKRKREQDKVKKEVETKLSKPELALKKLDVQVEKKGLLIKECEISVNSLDEKLRVANIQRTRFLGRDRYWNKYYWFERNGMSFSPNESESSFACGYMNGRIWIQGPDKTEAEGFLNLSPSEMAEYTKRIGEDIPTRRQKEENGTTLEGPNAWGYIDNPTDLDALVDVWLDERGIREKSLVKELRAWREGITSCMRALRQYQDGLSKTAVEGEAPVEQPHPTVITRTSSRLKSVQQQSEPSEVWPAQKWTNNSARQKLGYLHGEGKMKKPSGKKATAPPKTVAAAPKGAPRPRAKAASR